MVVKNAGIQFHRRSRYEDILELVNDDEEALKPFPNRDAVFYKQSNKGTRFDGKDHLDKLKVQEKQIAERIVRDHMLREYASDNNFTHRALFTEHDRPEPEQPRSPEMFRIATDTDNMSFIEEFGTPPEQQLFQIDETLGNVATAHQGNQQAINQAHQQQLEREEEGGSGILRSLGSGALSLGSGALRVGGNVAGNMISGMDFTSAAFAGLTQEAAQALGETLMRRINPPPRQLLDFSGDPRAAGQFTTYDPMPIPNMEYLQPSIVLQPHQPNVGATQQPLPIASSSQPTLAELPPIPRPIPQRPTEPRTKSRPRPSPKTPPPPQPNFQEGGSQSSRASGDASRSFARSSTEASSSSSGNAPPPQPPQNERPRTRLTRKTNLKEGTTEEQDMASPTLIIPSKIGIQKLREVFEEANNRNTINTKTYRSYKSIYNNWIRSAGDKELKKQYLKELKDLYRQHIFRK